MPLKKYTNNQKKMIKRHIKYKIKQTAVEGKNEKKFKKRKGKKK